MSQCMVSNGPAGRASASEFVLGLELSTTIRLRHSERDLGDRNLIVRRYVAACSEGTLPLRELTVNTKRASVRAGRRTGST